MNNRTDSTLISDRRITYTLSQADEIRTKATPTSGGAIAGGSMADLWLSQCENAKRNDKAGDFWRRNLEKQKKRRNFARENQGLPAFSNILPWDMV